MAKKKIVRTRYPLEDNIKRALFIRPGTGTGGPSVPGILEIPYATRQETDAGTLTDKVLNPDVGAYAYDRFRYVGRHAAGKGTKVVSLSANTGVFTIDCAKSNVFELVLTDDGMEIANPVNPINGQTVNIHVRQPAEPVEGGNQATFGTQWTFANKIDPVFTNEAGATDLLSCQWDPSAGKMRCTLVPNFGNGYVPPPDYTLGDFSFVSLGGGNEVVIGRDEYLPEIYFRTIVGGGDIDVSTDGDTLVVSYTAPSGGVEYLDDLTDVDVSTAGAGDALYFDGENWVPAPMRKWSLGATFTNGANNLAVPVNEVNAMVTEKSRILAWYLLTNGETGSAEVDVRKVAVSSFPPDSGDSICGGDEPSITSARMNSSDDLSLWDADCEEGDILQFVLNSTSGFNSVQIILILQRVP